MRFLLFSFKVLLFLPIILLAQRNSDPIKDYKTKNIDELICKIRKQAELPTIEFKEYGFLLKKLNSDNTQQINNYSNFAIAQGEYIRQNYDKAQLYFDSTLIEISKSNDTLLLRTTLNQLGNINYILRNDKEAFDYYQQAFIISSQSGNKRWIANVYNNLGLVSHHQKDYKQAEFYYSNAISIYEQLDDSKSIADVNFNRAMSNSYAKNNELAEKYAQLSLETYKSLMDTEGIANSTYFLGQINEDRKNYSIADEFYNQSFDMFKTLHDSVNLMPCLMKLSYSSIRKGDYKTAGANIELFKTINNRIKDIEGTKEILKLQYILFKNTGDSKRALENLEQLDIIKDTITERSDAQKLAQLRVQFAQEIQERELIQLKQSSQAKNIIIVLVIVAFILTTSSILINWKRYKVKEEKRLLLLEHKVLRTQMNPHFIFNAMSTLQCYIMDEKPEEAIAFLSDFSSLLRLVLQYSKTEVIPISKEKKILDCYMSLQNKRFDNKIKFELIIDQPLFDNNVMIPPMLAQPFVENSLEHGGLDQIENATIIVRLHQGRNCIKLSIEDNGIGIEESLKNTKENDHKSMAMSITNERLKLLSKNQKEKVHLQITDLSNMGLRGTKVEFMIPI